MLHLQLRFNQVIKRLAIILVLLINVTNVWCQTEISGTVISIDDMSPIPGVNVVEKGTRNVRHS